MPYEDAHRECRERQRADVESRWPPAVRDRLRTNHGSDRIYGIWRETFLAGQFDHLWQFLKPDKAAVDVGSLLGQYSLTLAAFSTRCLCLEPLEQYRFLAEALPPNCIHRTVAAGARIGRGTLGSPVYPAGNIEFGLSSLLPQDWPPAWGVREQLTEIRPLDHIIAEALGDEPVGFIKIDVESYELEVLRGAEQTLVKHRPNLQVEVQPRHVRTVRDLMESMGFRGFFFYRRRVMDVRQFCEALHMAAEHMWTPERRDEFDQDRVASDFFFVPMSRAIGARVSVLPPLPRVRGRGDQL